MQTTSASITVNEINAILVERIKAEIEQMKQGTHDSSGKVGCQYYPEVFQQAVELTDEQRLHSINRHINKYPGSDPLRFSATSWAFQFTDEHIER